MLKRILKSKKSAIILLIFSIICIVVGIVLPEYPYIVSEDTGLFEMLNYSHTL